MIAPLCRSKMENEVSNEFQAAKDIVRRYQSAFDGGSNADLVSTLRLHVRDDYHWRGMHPFYEQTGAEAVCATFWKPFKTAFTSVQRREDVFFAGANDVDDGASIWVCSMGHFMGLFDEPWLGIAPTGKIAFLRYAEFHKVEDGKIVETALFCDLISVMQQAGQYPLPPQTGAAFIHPGPRTHDGQLNDGCAPEEAKATMALLNRMIADLDGLNKSGNDQCPPELLAQTWHDDMAWYGPAGIGATYTIKRYQQQHQYPFREGLTDKVYNGHIARLAEGNFAGFFGWANLNNRLSGGFLGMPAGEADGEMRIVDIYRRSGDKLAENWVFIDLLHYFSMQGLNLLERNRQTHGR